MKLKWLSIILAFVVTTNAAALDKAPPQPLAPLPEHVQTIQLATSILKRSAYRAISFNTATSDRIFGSYISALDPEKLIFVQGDLDQFADARHNLGEDIENGNLHLPFEIFQVYKQRVITRFTYARELLKDGFDFTRDESVESDRKNAPYPQTEEEVRELWRKRIKNDWLQLKLAGKELAEIRATLDKRIATMLSRADTYNSNDVFQVFMDAVANAVDPHTDYLAPAESKNFDIAMSLSLFGVGAALQEKDEYPTIRELIPGGPAALSSQLHVGDRIVGVGQGGEGAIVDVIGMRLDEVVDLVRGPKDSLVRLEVLPADSGANGGRKIVTLARNKINLEQQAAKKSIISVRQGGMTQQVGVISLPTFYQDFDARRHGDKSFRSATRDVIRLLTELKDAKVDAVLIDLRNNGGGSLEEAVALTGLFTGTGPVVQERNAQGMVRVDSSTMTTPLWEGPLGVLINRASASASEIFAAAIQDHGRGVVIGEPSFGKGTVQTIVDLDQIVQNDSPKLGELKMTVAQFFRINGGTTQLKGVTPDIGFPPISDIDRFGESSYDNALPWAKINPAGDLHTGELGTLLPLLKRRHELRVAKDKAFQDMLEEIADLRAQRQADRISLNEAERIKDRSMRELRHKSRDVGNAVKGGTAKATYKTDGTATQKVNTVDATEVVQRASSDDASADPKMKAGKDLWLIEAAHIVADEVELLRAVTKYAAGKQSALQ